MTGNRPSRIAPRLYDMQQPSGISYLWVVARTTRV
jgi:hypothetical protein